MTDEQLKTGRLSTRLLRNLGLGLQRVSDFLLAQAETRVQADEANLAAQASASDNEAAVSEDTNQPPAHWLERVQASNAPEHWLAHVSGSESVAVENESESMENESLSTVHEIAEEETTVSPSPPPPQTTLPTFSKQPPTKPTTTPASQNVTEDSNPRSSTSQQPNLFADHPTVPHTKSHHKENTTTNKTEKSTSQKPANFETSTPKQVSKRLRPLTLQKPIMQGKRPLPPVPPQPKLILLEKRPFSPQPSPTPQPPKMQPPFSPDNTRSNPNQKLDFWQKSNFSRDAQRSRKEKQPAFTEAKSKPRNLPTPRETVRRVATRKTNPSAGSPSTQHNRATDHNNTYEEWRSRASSDARRVAPYNQVQVRSKAANAPLFSAQEETNGRSPHPKPQFTTTQPAQPSIPNPQSQTSIQPTWPSLPEKQPNPIFNWEKEQREQRRRQRLNQEQQGELWNA
ncbi:MAG: hypothetical protein AAF614_12205 [Chloroflexota bacterium]